MKTVYLLESESFPGKNYTGVTDDHEQRLKYHNGGKCPHTAKYRPWRLRVSMIFADDQQAYDFERYLKTGSGRAFAKRHL